MIDASQWIEGADPVLLGECVFLPDSKNPLITLNNKTFLQSGSIINDDAANYPDAFAQFANVRPNQPDKWNKFVYPDLVGSSGFYGIATGNGVTIARTPSGKRYRTTDGLKWDLIPAGTVSYVWDIIFAAGLFVMNCSLSTGDGNSTAIMTSPDGLTWTLRTIPLNFYSLMIWTGTNFVLVSLSAYSGTNTNNLASSPDGITWTARAGTALTTSVTRFNGANGSAFYTYYVLNTGFVTVRAAANYTSWSAISSLNNKDIQGMVWSTTLAKGFLVTSEGEIMSCTSIAGAWTSVATMPTGLGGIVIFNDYLIAYGTGIYISTDGVTWTQVSTEPYLRGLTFMPGVGYFAAPWTGSSDGSMLRTLTFFVGVTQFYVENGSALYMRVK